MDEGLRKMIGTNREVLSRALGRALNEEELILLSNSCNGLVVAMQEFLGSIEKIAKGKLNPHIAVQDTLPPGM